MLCTHAECLELEELAATSVEPILLQGLNDLLLEVYNVLRPRPLDYQQRNTLVHVFNKMTNEIFGKFPFHAAVYYTLSCSSSLQNIIVDTY